MNETNQSHETLSCIATGPEIQIETLPHEDKIQLKLSACGCTDPGVVRKQNQDVMFTHSNGKHLILAIFDGHGRELGKRAAIIAKDSFALNFQDASDAIYDQLEAEPELTLRKMYTQAHLAIKAAFSKYYKDMGYSIKEITPGGYLMKRLHRSKPYTCVSGGTTVTLAVVLNGKRLIVSNVGDSDALLLGTSLNYSDLHAHTVHGPPIACPEPEDTGDEAAASPLILTADHSPESSFEYKRIAQLRSSAKDSKKPELLFMYDIARSGRRTPIFKQDEEGEPIASKEGFYYKNVRREWATVVSTPSTAVVQDALSFTRSLGDFHLHSYGVSSEPDIVELDLQVLLQHQTSTKKSQSIALVLASDGLWDNWKYQDLSTFLTAPERIERSKEKSGTQHIVRELMSKNKEYAHANFGQQADNMTVIVCYIHGLTL